jgi:hypothetical protein
MIKSSLLALAFAVASIPMFAQANPPAQQPAATNSTATHTKVKKHAKKPKVKKSKSNASTPSK